MFEYHNVDHFRCNDLRRWKLSLGKILSVRLHHWVQGDPPHYQHSHPWNFLTVVLRGGYDDVGEARPVDHVRAPAVRYRRLDWRHSVINCLPGTWTVVITGRALSQWKFWIRDNPVSEAQWNLRTCD